MHNWIASISAVLGLVITVPGAVCGLRRWRAARERAAEIARAHAAAEAEREAAEAAERERVAAAEAHEARVKRARERLDFAELRAIYPELGWEEL
jgi:type VI protein secretion system component VasK